MGTHRVLLATGDEPIRDSRCRSLFSVHHVKCERMDAAGAVDAQNAPTVPWKTAQNAVSHSAHPHHRFRRKKEPNESRQPALHTKFRTVPIRTARRTSNPEPRTPNLEPRTGTLQFLPEST